MPLAAVGFDLDYTLCVPVADRATLLEEATAAVDVQPIDRADYLDVHRRNLTGDTRAPIFAELLKEGEADLADELARVYRERVNAAIRLVDGAKGLLARLRDRYPVGLLTNGPTAAQRGKIESLGLADAFDTVLVSGELPAGKPDARAFDALAEGLGVPRDELAYVGDDVEADIVGATAAGCWAIQVVRDGGPEADPRADAHVRLESLAVELPQTLAELS